MFVCKTVFLSFSAKSPLWKKNVCLKIEVDLHRSGLKNIFWIALWTVHFASLRSVPYRSTSLHLIVHLPQNILAGILWLNIDSVASAVHHVYFNLTFWLFFLAYLLVLSNHWLLPLSQHHFNPYYEYAVCYMIP
jgi:hypothetical protein